MLQDHATDEATAKGRKSNVVTVAELRECINSLDIRPKLNETEFRTIVKAAREEDSDDSGGGDDGDDSSDEDESWRRARSRRGRTGWQVGRRNAAAEEKVHQQRTRWSNS